MRRLEGLVAWTRVVVKDRVRCGSILEIKIFLEIFLVGLTEGFNIKSRRN
jgi:hypothetical protein